MQISLVLTFMHRLLPKIHVLHIFALPDGAYGKTEFARLILLPTYSQSSRTAAVGVRQKELG